VLLLCYYKRSILHRVCALLCLTDISWIPIPIPRMFGFHDHEMFSLFPRLVSKAFPWWIVEQLDLAASGKCPAHAAHTPVRVPCSILIFIVLLFRLVAENQPMIALTPICDGCIPPSPLPGFQHRGTCLPCITHTGTYQEQGIAQRKSTMQGHEGK